MGSEEWEVSVDEPLTHQALTAALSETHDTEES